MNPSDKPLVSRRSFCLTATSVGLVSLVGWMMPLPEASKQIPARHKPCLRTGVTVENGELHFQGEMVAQVNPTAEVLCKLMDGSHTVEELASSKTNVHSIDVGMVAEFCCLLSDAHLLASPLAFQTYRREVVTS